MIRVRRSISRAQSGMSLIEILIAVTIFSIVMLGFTSLFRYSLISWVKIVGKFNNNSNLTGAIDIMAQDFRCALPMIATNSSIDFEGYDKTGSPPETLYNTIDDKIMFHSATYNSKENDDDQGAQNGCEVVKVVYWLRRDTTNDSRVTKGKAGYNGDNTTPTIPVIWDISDMGGAVTDEMVHGVTDFNLEYYNGTSWVNEWHGSAGGSLPSLVRITMKTTKFGSQTNIVAVVKPRPSGAYISQ